jgi:Outer membrane protein beta-barrel domain
MKKIVNTLLFVSIFICATAQKRDSKLRIGFKLDPNIAWMNNDENGITSGGNGLGLSYGFMVDYNFGGNYYFSSGISIANVGTKLAYTGNQWPNKQVGLVFADTGLATNVATYKMNIQYLEIPFALKLKTNNSSKLNYWGSFGGFVSFPIKARTDISTNFKVGGIANFSEENHNFIGDIQPINLGMQVGVGVEYEISESNTLQAGLIFNNGLLDATRNVKFGNDGGVNVNSISLRLGLYF